MSQQRSAVRTPVDVEELLQAYYGVWLHRLRGSAPSMRALEIITAQWAIETGWGRYCRCWNLGNAKTRACGAYDWTYFPCGEELPLAVAQKEAQRDPRVTVVRRYTLGGKAMGGVHIEPEHPWCCFRAFGSLTEGAADHLTLLHRGFPAAFAAALNGEPRAFASELKRAGYYTASVQQYTNGILGCLGRVEVAADQIDWDLCPVLTEGQKVRVDGIIALTAELDDDDRAAMRDERDRDVAD